MVTVEEINRRRRKPVEEGGLGETLEIQEAKKGKPPKVEKLTGEERRALASEETTSRGIRALSELQQEGATRQIETETFLEEEEAIRTAAGITPEATLAEEGEGKPTQEDLAKAAEFFEAEELRDENGNVIYSGTVTPITALDVTTALTLFSAGELFITGAKTIASKTGLELASGASKKVLSTAITGKNIFAAAGILGFISSALSLTGVDPFVVFKGKADDIQQAMNTAGEETSATVGQVKSGYKTSRQGLQEITILEREILQKERNGRVYDRSMEQSNRIL